MKARPLLKNANPEKTLNKNKKILIISFQKANASLKT